MIFLETNLCNIKRRRACGLLFFFLSIIWMTVIFIFSAQTGSDSTNMSRNFITNFVIKIFPLKLDNESMEILDFIIRKLAHFTEYAILGMFITLTLMTINVKINKYRLFMATVLCCLYAISDEFHQMFTDGRTPALRDVVIDTVGGFVGSLIVFLSIYFLLYKERSKYNDSR